MNRIFAPWRMKFIVESKVKKDSVCILCALLEQKDSEENLILSRSSDSYIVVNKYPYNTAHLMVVPNVHEHDFVKLSSQVMTSIHQQLQQVVRVLSKVYQPSGFNIGINLGEVAGAGIPKHVHYHIVPRWVGDNNFMPIVGDTKVLPETPEQTYQRLKDHF